MHFCDMNTLLRDLTYMYLYPEGARKSFSHVHVSVITKLLQFEDMPSAG